MNKTEKINAREFLLIMIRADKKEGYKFFQALDAIGHFFFCFEESEIKDPYKHRWTDSKITADNLYVFCSKYLFDQEFTVLGLMQDNDIKSFLDFVETFQQEIDNKLQ
jgi:hypothetical protein